MASGASREAFYKIVLRSEFAVHSFPAAANYPTVRSIRAPRATLRYNSTVTRTYVLVVLVEIVVIAALWAFGRVFS